MDPDFLAAGIDFEHANAARMYDYFLGGAHHFAVDRDAAVRVLSANPHTTHVVRSMRAYMGRAVSWCLARGIDQFLDLGSGIPTVGNVHEIAHGANADARVAYVDFEPVAVAHSQELLADVPGVSITRADVRDPATVLAAPGVAGLIDFARPVAVLAVGLLHFVDDHDLAVMGAGYRAALVPHSAVVINHVSADYDDEELVARIRAGTDAYRGTATEARLRTRAQLLALLSGFDLAEPGLVDVTDWPRPDPATPPAGVLAAVGTLRAP